MKRLRILTVSKPYVAAAYRRKLAYWANRGDMDVGLICPPAWGSQKFETDSSTDSTGVTIAIKPLWLNAIFNGKNHLHLYRGLTQAVQEFKPDILNIEEEHYSLVTWQCVRAALKVGAKPIFYTWQNIHKRYPPPFCHIEQFVFRHCQTAIAGNAEAAAILKTKGYKGQVRIIPQMGVAVETFSPELQNSGDQPPAKQRLSAKNTVGLNPNAFWLGFAGRLVAEKGLMDLLKALAIARRNAGVQPQADIRLALIGSGPQESELRQASHNLGLTDAVTFVPAVKSTEIAPWLWAIDCLCLPSRTRPNWKEQFGRILAEAMVAECVVVGSNSGEIPVVIGDAGFVFPEGDCAALADILQKLAANPDLVERYRSLGAKRAKKHFANEVIAEAFAIAFHETAALN